MGAAAASKGDGRGGKKRRDGIVERHTLCWGQPVDLKCACSKTAWRNHILFTLFLIHFTELVFHSYISTWILFLRCLPSWWRGQ